MRILLVAMLVAGCHKQATDDGPPCERIVDNMLTITKQPLSGRDKAIERCKQRKLSAEARYCVGRAKTLDQLARCMPMREGDPESPADRTVQQRPVGSVGSGDGVSHERHGHPRDDGSATPH